MRVGKAIRIIQGIRFEAWAEVISGLVQGFGPKQLQGEIVTFYDRVREAAWSQELVWGMLHSRRLQVSRYKAKLASGYMFIFFCCERIIYLHLFQ